MSANLTTLGFGHPGVMLFLGHASPGPEGAPAEAALMLTDGPLYAREFLASDPRAAGFPLPAKVVFSACGSLGDPGTGGEWLGLGPAALWAGATEVVATSFPVLDHPTTTSYDHHIANSLATGERAATVVRALQLGELSRWRTWTADGPPPVPLFTDYAQAMHDQGLRPPILWAPYVVLGIGSLGG